jgi:hypothetical protein
MVEELTTIREQILALEKLIGQIKRKRTQERLLGYLNSLLEVKENLIRLKRRLRRTQSSILEMGDEDAEDIDEVVDLVGMMLKGIEDIERNVQQTSTENLDEEVRSLRIDFSELSGSLPVEQIMFLVDFSTAPQEIREEIKLDFDEMRICYNNGAFRSAIIMCGRVLELLLAKKYFDSTHVDPVELRWQLGVLIRKCFERNVLTDPGIGDICNFINHLRISSVHASHAIHRPIQEETKSVIEFTISLLKSLYPPIHPTS